MARSVLEIPHDVVEPMLASAGFTGTFQMTRLGRGRNNFTARLRSDGWDLVAKKYFRHPDDPRDRLGAEYSFIEFLWRRGLRNIPEPLAVDARSEIALYSYVNGTVPTPRQVDRHAVDSASAFVASINEWRNHDNATQLNTASEACFSIREHLDLVERRVEAIRSAGGEVGTFAARDISDVWERIRDAAETAAGKGMSAPLAQSDRCLSPSDFGFHNSLRKNDGTYVFLDFEYAGWDDPAKLICDFFCQVEIPVSVEYFDAFASRVAGVLPNTEEIKWRAGLLMPVYRIKWCCISLNQFLPVGAERRAFADSLDCRQPDIENQLSLARSILETARASI